MKLVATLSVVLAAFWAVAPGEHVLVRDASHPPSAATDRDADGAGVLARQWATSLFSGDVEVAMALCDVPFAWDRKKIITNVAELRDMIKSVVKDKGERAAPVFEVTKVSEISKIEDDLYPKSYFVVHLALGEGTIRVAVRGL